MLCILTRREHAYEGKSVLARLKEEVKEVTVRIKDEVGEVKARIRAMSDREDGEEVEMEEEDIEENEEDLQVQTIYVQQCEIMLFAQVAALKEAQILLVIVHLFNIDYDSTKHASSRSTLWNFIFPLLIQFPDYIGDIGMFG